MTALPELHLLDVGHGNASLVLSEKVCVADCPRKPQLRDKLRELGISKVSHAIVSHSDADHLLGIANLLIDESIVVEQLIVNPDASKKSDAWEDFRRAVGHAMNERGLKLNLSVHSKSEPIDLGNNVVIHIVSPTVENAMTGPGGLSLAGTKIDANSGSIGLLVTCDGRSRALLAGDMTFGALEWAKADGRTLEADILVFPHHGGNQQVADNGKVAVAWLKAVAPSTVIFSIGRGKYETPKPEIIAEVVSGGCTIACTQLSTNCHKEEVALPDGHIAEISDSKTRGFGCAGSLVFDLAHSQTDQEKVAGHRGFVDANVPGALCRPSPEHALTS